MNRLRSVVIACALALAVALMPQCAQIRSWLASPPGQQLVEVAQWVVAHDGQNVPVPPEIATLLDDLVAVADAAAPVAGEPAAGAAEAPFPAWVVSMVREVNAAADAGLVVPPLVVHAARSVLAIREQLAPAGEQSLAGKVLGWASVLLQLYAGVQLGVTSVSVRGRQLLATVLANPRAIVPAALAWLGAKHSGPVLQQPAAPAKAAP